jgi:hypothetical protein
MTVPFSDLLYLSTARSSPVKDATCARSMAGRVSVEAPIGMTRSMRRYYCSDGADGLLDDDGRLGVGGLAEGRHPGDGAGEDERRDGGEHDEREEPPLRERDREAAEERDEQLDELAGLLAHGIPGRKEAVEGESVNKRTHEQNRVAMGMAPV